jgi:hypothetical protein
MLAVALSFSRVKRKDWDENVGKIWNIVFSTPSMYAQRQVSFPGAWGKIVESSARQVRAVGIPTKPVTKPGYAPQKPKPS